MKTEYIFRSRKNFNYTVFDNNDLQNSNLGIKAVGLLTRLLSLPSDYKISLRRMAGDYPDGKATLTTAMNELVEHNYAFLAPVRLDDNGALAGKRWFVSDDPNYIHQIKDFVSEYGFYLIVENPDSGEPGNRTVGKAGPIKSNKEQSNIKLHSPKLSLRDGQEEKDGKAIWSHDSWQYKGSLWVWSRLDERDALANSIRNKKEQTLQKWADVLDKIVRIDKHNKEDINLTLKWLFDTADDVDQYDQPENGGFWLIKAKFSSMSNLRNSVRNGSKTKFEAMLDAQRNYNKEN